MAIECATCQWPQRVQLRPSRKITQNSLISRLAADNSASLAGWIRDDVVGTPIKRAPPQLPTAIADCHGRKSNLSTGIVATSQQMRRHRALMIEHQRAAFPETIETHICHLSRAVAIKLVETECHTESRWHLLSQEIAQVINFHQQRRHCLTVIMVGDGG